MLPPCAMVLAAEFVAEAVEDVERLELEVGEAVLELAAVKAALVRVDGGEVEAVQLDAPVLELIGGGAGVNQREALGTGDAPNGVVVGLRVDVGGVVDVGGGEGGQNRHHAPLAKLPHNDV